MSQPSSSITLLGDAGDVLAEAPAPRGVDRRRDDGVVVAPRTAVDRGAQQRRAGAERQGRGASRHGRRGAEQLYLDPVRLQVALAQEADDATGAQHLDHLAGGALVEGDDVEAHGRPLVREPLEQLGRLEPLGDGGHPPPDVRQVGAAPLPAADVGQRQDHALPGGDRGTQVLLALTDPHPLGDASGVEGRELRPLGPVPPVGAQRAHQVAVQRRCGDLLAVLAGDRAGEVVDAVGSGATSADARCRRRGTPRGRRPARSGSRSSSPPRARKSQRRARGLTRRVGAPGPPCGAHALRDGRARASSPRCARPPPRHRGRSPPGAVEPAPIGRRDERTLRHERPAADRSGLGRDAATQMRWKRPHGGAGGEDEQRPQHRHQDGRRQQRDARAGSAAPLAPSSRPSRRSRATLPSTARTRRGTPPPGSRRATARCGRRGGPPGTSQTPPKSRASATRSVTESKKAPRMEAVPAALATAPSKRSWAPVTISRQMARGN